MIGFLNRNRGSAAAPKEAKTVPDTGARVVLAPAEPTLFEVPPPLEVVASLLTAAGCRRAVNEDCSRYARPLDDEVMKQKGRLAIVADGMGGGSTGEVASRIATEVIDRVYYDEDGDRSEALIRAFQAANREIYEASSSSDEALRGMSTTCTALVLLGRAAICAHVGNSRLYLVRGGEIYLLTEDHSATIENAAHHRDENPISQALGSHPRVDIAIPNGPLPVMAGDKFLLCTDGLHNLVTDAEIKRAVNHKAPQSACDSLVTLARERGGFDNITVGVLSVEARKGSRDRSRPSSQPVPGITVR